MIRHRMLLLIVLSAGLTFGAVMPTGVGGFNLAARGSELPLPSSRGPLSWMRDGNAPPPIVPAKQSDLLRLSVRGDSKVARRIVFLVFVLWLAAAAAGRLRSVVTVRGVALRSLATTSVATRAPPRLRL